MKRVLARAADGRIAHARRASSRRPAGRSAPRPSEAVDVVVQRRRPTPSSPATRAASPRASPSASAIAAAVRRRASRSSPAAARATPPPWRSRRPSPRAGTPRPCRGPAPAAPASARAARGRSRASVGRCQVDIAGSGKRRLGFAVVATPPSVVNASPQSSVPSRVSRKATCPGVWPGEATTSSEPTRSPGASGPRRPRLGARVAAAQLGLRLAGISVLSLASSRASRAEIRTSTPGSAAASVVERADVVAVGVGQRDPHDRRAELRGGRAGSPWRCAGSACRRASARRPRRRGRR